MKNIVALLSGLLIALFAQAADIPSLLSQLSEHVTNARALPAGMKSSYLCPENLTEMNGMDFNAVLATLPRPDLRNERSASYFLTSTVKSGQRGGGFLEITFVSGESGAVERVTCAYSR